MSYYKTHFEKWFICHNDLMRHDLFATMTSLRHDLFATTTILRHAFFYRNNHFEAWQLCHNDRLETWQFCNTIALFPFWRAKSPICPVNFFVTLMHRWRKQGIKYRIFRLVFLSDCFTLLMFFGAITMEHYCKKLMGVVVFAKVQGQVKFECPRTRRHHFSARAYFLHKK